MDRYHLNPRSGEPGKCRAEQQCPFGGETDHYATEEAARFAYELQMQDELTRSLAARRQEEFDAYARGLDPTYEARLQERLAELAHREANERLRARKLEEEREQARLKRSFLSREEAEAINTDGITCPTDNCGQQLTALQASLLMDEQYAVKCTRCSTEFGLYEVNIQVGQSKDTYAAFDAANVPKMTWYHSTLSEDWEATLTKDEGFYAHLGSQQAAYDRQIAELYSGAGKPPATFYLYEVGVDEDSSIAETIEKDENEDYSTEYSPTTKPMAAEVTRYVNKWEDMASISLVAATPKLKVRGVRQVTVEEALKSPSLYNVDPKMAREEKA